MSLKSLIRAWLAIRELRSSPIARRAFDAGRSGLSVTEAWSEQHPDLLDDVKAYATFHAFIKRTWWQTIKAWCVGG